MLIFKKKYFWRILLAVVIIDIFVVAGHYYYDLKSRFPDMDWQRSRLGVASWYSEKDKGIKKHTANGEKFDDGGDTCATWHYSFNEKLLVINALNGKWVVCRVNDRGPAKRLKREIDLTKSAFQKISKRKHGLIPVTVIPIEPKKPVRAVS